MSAFVTMLAGNGTLKFAPFTLFGQSENMMKKNLARKVQIQGSLGFPPTIDQANI